MFMPIGIGGMVNPTLVFFGFHFVCFVKMSFVGDHLGFQFGV